MVTLNFLPVRYELTPEAKEHIRMITDPQDLNEALLSVAADKAVIQIISDIETQFLERLGLEVRRPPAGLRGNRESR